MTRFPALALAVLMLTQCGAPKAPSCPSVPKESRVPAAALIAEARADWHILANPARRAQWPAAQAAYNDAVAKLFDQMRCPARPWQEAAASLGTRIQAHGEDDAYLENIQSLFPANLVNTSSVGPRQTTPGLGIPLVGWHAQSSEGKEQSRAKFAPPTGQPFNVTAVLRFDRGSQPTWQFGAPLQKDSTEIGGRTVKYNTDWSASHAFYWHMSDLDDFDALKVILPDRFTEETGLYFGQPYDPDRIPLVFIHGINSSPAAFKHLINTLAGEEWFRKKYQVWLFNYPTGNPWILSAARFRSYMNAAAAYAKAHGDRGNINKTVIVAHSMGGLITRTAVSEPGQCFYDGFFKKPIDQLNLSPQGRQMIETGILYHPITFPDRIVFMAVPHQGSPLAERVIFTWLSRLVRLPKTLTVEMVDIAMRNAGNMLLPESGHLPTAIDNLSPNDPSVQALQKTHLPSRLHLHSIIGDRGRGDTPNSSDGIVPYWSSHLDHVESEKIVPSGHGVPSNEEAGQEVIRILRKHAGIN
ncbi:alpha/beta hydrolase [Luteolibacter ambystomatis]|uniref:Alpha/beta hydrolase n=1 Tax=Luteolibacter ambystomatis TaxID=2824561 RepID=A0A975G9A4_9BACT|nr:alpha/beta hydrolase [Luteolibacter ambystomatis]QUE51131.1 alpha/beta hydrolase [Luteolibacter ambystomatis]